MTYVRAGYRLRDRRQMQRSSSLLKVVAVVVVLSVGLVASEGSCSGPLDLCVALWRGFYAIVSLRYRRTH